MTDSEILSRPRFEILPTRGAEEQVEGTEKRRQRMLGPRKASGTGALR